MKHFYVLILGIFFIKALAFGQRDYFVLDSVKVYGANLKDGGELINARQCQVKKGDKLLEYTPEEVSEFGFKNGRVYLSKEIFIAGSKKRVFLERICSGNTTLYYFRDKGLKTFFLERDSTLFVEVLKKDKDGVNYKEQLLDLTKECKYMIHKAKLASYNKPSLSRLIAMHNECELKPFPFFKFGIVLGANSNSLKAPPDYFIADFPYPEFDNSSSLSFGLFMEKPFLSSYFSFYIELIYLKNSFYSNSIYNIEEYDALAKLSSIEIPLLLKYTLPRMNFRPYVDAGPRYAQIIKQQNAIFNSVTTDNTVNINYLDDVKLFSNQYLGYSFGLGFLYNLSYRNSASLELRYSQLFSLGEKNKMNINRFELIIGINF